MPISMALVAYEKTILVHDKLSPSAKPAVQKIVENLPRHDHKVAYEYQGTKYHCMVENKLVYICGSDPEFTLRASFGFLTELKTKFKTTFAGSANEYPTPANLNPTVCAKFATQIAATIRMFNENPESSDKIGKVKKDIEAVRQVMLNNIDEVMERGDKIETLVFATEDLATTAQNFEDNSKTLKRAMIMRNLKLLAAIIIALIILSLIISWIACGINYKKCKKDDPPPPPPGPTTPVPTPTPSTAAPTNPPPPPGPTSTPPPASSSSTLTVSGISSGAAMAVQFEVAFSASVRAAGITAGAPWDCSNGNLTTALDCMSSTGAAINVTHLNQAMAALAAANDIDAVANVRDHDVMLFSGLNDTVVSQRGMRALADQYEALGANKVVKYFNYSAEHAWITDFYGNDCGYLGLPYINNCGLDFAGEFLRMAWSHMGLTFNDTRGSFDAARMRNFSQTAFTNVTAHSLSGVGYYYVPAACQGASAGCHVHLNFHGCQQDAASLGRTYVDNTGLNQWAESNRVIVVYPQTIASPPENPLACWDWWGYTGPDFLQRTGAQLAFAEAVVTHVTTNGELPSAPSN